MKKLSILIILSAWLLCGCSYFHAKRIENPTATYISVGKRTMKDLYLEKKDNTFKASLGQVKMHTDPTEVIESIPIAPLVLP